MAPAGLKALSLDSGPPLVQGHPEVEFANGGDEHGKLLWPAAGAVHAQGAPALPPLGALLKLQPGHCDPTVNLYDWIVAYRGACVEAVWPIEARGPGS